MLPNCHLCVVIGSSPVAFYFFVCTCCGFLVLCAWCACEHRLRGSPRSERAAPRRNSSRSDVSIRLDEIRRAKIVSRSLATAKVTTAAIHPSRTPLGDRRVLPRPPTASCLSGVFVSSPRNVGYHGRRTRAGICAGGSYDRRHGRKVASCIGFDWMGSGCVRDLH